MKEVFKWKVSYSQGIRKPNNLQMMLIKRVKITTNDKSNLQKQSNINCRTHVRHIRTHTLVHYLSLSTQFNEKMALPMPRHMLTHSSIFRLSHRTLYLAPPPTTNPSSLRHRFLSVSSTMASAAKKVSIFSITLLLLFIEFLIRLILFIQVLVPIANGTEPIEAVITTDVLRRSGADVTVASVENQHRVDAGHAVKIVADALISDCANTVFDLITLPVQSSLSIYLSLLNFVEA